uniref:Uncharacterized protein n=1 Tax=Ixodes scapularis TaxID=6945 RepID=A0A4D5RFV6_IXOSC
MRGERGSAFFLFYPLCYGRNGTVYWGGGQTVTPQAVNLTTTRMGTTNTMTQRSADITERGISVRLEFVFSGEGEEGLFRFHYGLHEQCSMHDPSSAQKPKWVKLAFSEDRSGT